MTEQCPRCLSSMFARQGMHGCDFCQDKNVHLSDATLGFALVRLSDPKALEPVKTVVPIAAHKEWRRKR